MFQLNNLKTHIVANKPHWLLFACLAVMYLPTLSVLFQDGGLWTNDKHSHGPIILLVSLWLLWDRWSDIQEEMTTSSDDKLAWLCFIVGALLYVTGRVLTFIYFDAFSFIVILAGILLLLGGRSLLNKLKFPLFFMLFMIPLPSLLVNPISNWMKLFVSSSTVEILNLLDLPVAQEGVVISLGQYKMLVADACAGMRTLFMLEALGILYLNLVKHTSTLRNYLLPVFIIPISFTANIIRVLVLCLITYYWGSEAGQGFLHGFAGMVLFLAGLIIMMATDNLLRFISLKLNKKRNP